ncbi:MAG: nucleotidyltransferase, partial [Bacteroidota bacterium]|nr:nucleotidyltransferase [Bacteroidota bacterium]
INADDYYGPESYQTLYDFLTTKRDQEEYGVVGYQLENTLSEHGTVNRGVCSSDENGYLQNIVECKQIGRDDQGVISYTDDEGSVNILSKNDPVSMNMWAFYPSYFTYFEKEFNSFLDQHGSELKSEYYIPTLVDDLIKSGERQTKVLHCDSEWFGVTYREDKEFVSQRLDELIAKNIYPKNLWEEK